MKTTAIVFFLLLPSLLLGQAIAFDDYFVNKTLRIDYYHVGNGEEELVTLDHMYKQGIWAGNPLHLIDPLGYGRYSVAVYDSATDQLIYSKGYDSYFGEYKTTGPAKDGVRRTFHESVLIPFPLKPVRVVIQVRNKHSEFEKLTSFDINPADYHINTESPLRGDEVIEALNNGDPHEKVDLVIVGDGYKSTEKEKFRKDLRRYAEVLFSLGPYKSMKKRFNIYGIFSASPQSGVDEPRQGSYKKTLLGSSFNSLDSDRYLLVEDNKALRDIAAQVPYDLILIMVNSKRYGGGGFYGYYAAFTSDGGWSDYVVHHEFGHTFGGLADEYYTSDVTYEDFYPEGVEPFEPNITRVSDPDNLKWKDLVSEGVEVPTEWGKSTYDSLGAAREALTKDHNEMAAQLKRDGVPADSIARENSAFQAALKNLNDRILKFMQNHPLRGKVGAFEGGGYLSTGIYRPTVNSIMNQFNTSDRNFYPVNERAIRKVIEYYTGK